MTTSTIVITPICKGVRVRQLLWDIHPRPSSGHHGLGINGPKAKLVADIKTSSIAGPFTIHKKQRGCGVGKQILHISPGEIRTGRQDKLAWNVFHTQCYLVRKRDLLCFKNQGNHTSSHGGRGTGTSKIRSTAIFTCSCCL